MSNTGFPLIHATYPIQICLSNSFEVITLHIFKSTIWCVFHIPKNLLCCFPVNNFGTCYYPWDNPNCMTQISSDWDFMYRCQTGIWWSSLKSICSWVPSIFTYKFPGASLKPYIAFFSFHTRYSFPFSTKHEASPCKLHLLNLHLMRNGVFDIHLMNGPPKLRSHG